MTSVNMMSDNAHDGANLQSRWDRVWSFVRGRPAEVKRAITIPRVRVVGSGDMPTEFDPKKHYFSVVINEMFLTNARQWWTEYDPMALIVSEFSYGGKRTIVPFVVGPSLIQADLNKVPNGVAITDTLVAGPHPYTGGKFALTVILAQVKRQSYAKNLLQIIENVAQVFPSGSALEPHLKVAGAVMDGVEALFGMGDTKPIVGQRWEYNDGMSPWLEPGFFALIDLDTNKVDPERMSVVGGRLCDHPRGSPMSGFRDSNFLLYSLRILERRTDFKELPFYSLFQSAQKAAASTEEGSWDRAKAALVTLYQEMLLSPDLTFAQAQELAGEFKATLVEINERAKALVLGKQRRAGYGDKDGRLKLGDLAYPSTEGPARLDELRKIHSLLKL
jgi:hypothetical protein